MYTRILVPLDGSGLSEQVLPTAVHLARQVGGMLILLRAIPARRPATVERDTALTYLSRVAAEAVAAGVTVEYLAVAGPAGPAVVRAAGGHTADLIALKSRGEHGFRRALVGSVAGHVIRASSVPVLILRQRALLPAQSADADGHQSGCWAVVALDGSVWGERSQ